MITLKILASDGTCHLAFWECAEVEWIEARGLFSPCDMEDLRSNLDLQGNLYRCLPHLSHYNTVGASGTINGQWSPRSCGF